MVHFRASYLTTLEIGKSCISERLTCHVATEKSRCEQGVNWQKTNESGHRVNITEGLSKLGFRVASNGAAMAASLLRRKTTHVARTSGDLLRAWASAETRLLADRAELEIAHCGARYSSSSAVSGYREVSRCSFASQGSSQLARRDSIVFLLPQSARGLASQTAPQLRQQVQEEGKGLSRQAEEDPFDSITDKIPERPVSVAEGASYSLVILAGLAVAGVAAYAVLKELIFEPKEYVNLCSFEFWYTLAEQSLMYPNGRTMLARNYMMASLWKQ
ncbi:hypothetical protein M758_6G094000 [Ceratodon purpureus]|nr:hypothetical protein M758_6G094000 [Ceratodon purpureus]